MISNIERRTHLFPGVPCSPSPIQVPSAGIDVIPSTIGRAPGSITGVRLGGGRAAMGGAELETFDVFAPSCREDMSGILGLDTRLSSSSECVCD